MLRPRQRQIFAPLFETSAQPEFRWNSVAMLARRSSCTDSSASGFRYLPQGYLRARSRSSPCNNQHRARQACSLIIIAWTSWRRSLPITVNEWLRCERCGSQACLGEIRVHLVERNQLATSPLPLPSVRRLCKTLVQRIQLSRRILLSKKLYVLPMVAERF